MRVSVVMTVLNEAASLPAVLATLAAQTRGPDEVVVVDGGSRDGTVATLRGYQGPLALTVLERPGANISQGRNAAIAAATGEVIAVTDAGVRLDATWLAALVAPFAHDPTTQAVAGFFRSDPVTLFEAVLGATTLPVERDVRSETFLPSSRSVAFGKAVWERAGGYPEWLDYCEDLGFDLAGLRLGGRFAWAPQAVAHFRPRPTLAAFCRQYCRYARGDGKAGLWRKRHAIRYGAYTGGLALAWLALSMPVLWLLLMAAGLASVATPISRLLPRLPDYPPWQWPYALALVPLIRLSGDLAKMAGYPAGVLWRRSNKIPSLQGRGGGG